MVCAFFGHRDAPIEIRDKILVLIKNLLELYHRKLQISGYTKE